jgi:site-specific recombinase XerC
MKLSDAFTLYVAESGALNTDASREAYRKTVRQLAHYCGDKALNSYTVDELTAFCLGDGGRGDAPHTVAARRTNLHSVFDWCAYRKLVAKDPTAELKHTVKPRGGNVRTHTWLTKADTVEHAARFNLEDPKSHRDLVVFRTTLMLGMRRSEVASLRWPMFRDDLSTVTFTGKGNKLATLPVPGALRTVLDRWHRLEPDGAVPFPRFRWQHDFAGNWRMAPAWGTAITAAGVYQIIRDHIDVAPHDLRRSLAGILEADGVPLKDVQGLMRHDNLATTDRYLERSPQRLARVVDTVDWG